MTSYPSSNCSTEAFLPYILNGSILVPSGGTLKEGNAFDEYKELQNVCSILFRYGATLAEMFAYQKYLQSNSKVTQTLSSHLNLSADFLTKNGVTIDIKPELGIELDFDSYLQQSH